MSLQGSFETIALPDVMALLGASTKSGELRVVGGHVEGRLWLEGGRLVASRVGKAEDHVDALFELLRLKEGNFVFRDGVEAPDAGQATPIEPVLREAEARLKEWEDIIQIVPSAEHRVRLIADLPTPDVTLSADEWRMVMAIALAGTVQGVLEELQFGQFAGFRGIRRLVDAGLVMVDPPRVRTAPHRPARRVAAAPAQEAGATLPGSNGRLALVAPPLVAVAYQAVPAAPPESIVAAAAPFEAPVDDDDDWYDDEAEEPDDGDAGIVQFPLPSYAVFTSRDSLAAAFADLEADDYTGVDTPPAAHDPHPGDGGYGGDSNGEAINRGLLLKFLSSVRS